ncbi:alpha/beta fold hydrolase [Streptomyces sp. NPDC052309]|uniref:Alpha/beta fold hydrolase n=1 Tax=Streptomyces griseicoloratus TaxID=2752516 RepID=A0A926L116_9ACTN|nr:alpha/beta fold hydrolase [Streptomyces griseicoloratus]MBD0420433.1 alpha/beta fold hydrolase [Streptomyces griseicoloratus]
MSAPTPAAPLACTVQGNGPALVLLHGTGGSATGTWGGILEPLGRHHTVLAPDLPGSGSTPRATEPLTLDLLADDVVAAAEAHGHTRFALAGYSLGASVAVRTAARHPDRVAALVLVAGVAYADPRIRLIAELWRDLTEHPRFLAKWGLIAGYREEELAELSPQDLTDAVSSGTVQEPGLTDQIGLLAQTDVRSDLPRVTAPTLVVSTAEDTFILPSHHRMLHEGIAGARFAELAAGHLLTGATLPRLAQAITEFLLRTGWTGTPTRP